MNKNKSLPTYFHKTPFRADLVKVPPAVVLSASKFFMPQWVMQMSNEFDPAIAAFERRREDALKSASEYERTINSLCKEASYPIRYPGAESGAASTAVVGTGRVQLSDDTFYGQKQTPAMRMYLEMRRAQGLGPATPKEIYDAIKAGGYVFEAKDEKNALVGMRALLRTQPSVFHRLPQGTYGLMAWYPDAKKPKIDKPKKKTAAAKKAAAAAKLRKPRAPDKPREPSKNPEEKGDA